MTRTDTAPIPRGPDGEGDRDWPRWPAEFAARYRAAGHWRGETFGQMLAARADAHPDRVAVVDPAGVGRRWTYRELDARARRMALGLSWHGIGRGDRVVLQLPNIAEFLEVLFALFRLGAVPVFALPAHRDTEIRHFCAFTEARAYVTTDVHAGFDHRALARRLQDELPYLEHVFVVGEADGHTALAAVAVPDEPAPHGPAPRDACGPGPAPDDLAFLQLSGGSTGVPKLIPRTHDDYIYSLRGSNEICGMDATSVYLCALPAAHNFPLSSPGVLGTLYAGGTVVMCPDPSPATAFALVAAERVTITGLVPPLALVWLDAVAATPPEARPDLSSLRLLQVGGAKFGEEVARRVRPVLGCRLQQVFGMAEGLVNYTRADDPEELVVTTQGRPISADDEIRIVDDHDRDLPPGEPGHLLTRGPYTIRGYWRSPDHNAAAFTADGFYRTGDIVRRTPTGHLVVEGRAKEQINRGGEKFSAEEVENHLLAHPAVRDAAVVPIPDRYLGERSCAYVVLRSGTQAVRAAELRRFVRGRGLARFKVPDRVEVVDALPATGVGKTSRRQLRSVTAPGGADDQACG